MENAMHVVRPCAFGLDGGRRPTRLVTACSPLCVGPDIREVVIIGSVRLDEAGEVDFRSWQV